MRLRLSLNTHRPIMHLLRSIPKIVHTLALSATLALTTVSASASQRHFGFIYETTTLPQGALDFENQATWKNNKNFDRFEFRHELEYGITDRFQAALYVADWSLRNDAEHRRTMRYDATALELIYNLSNPSTSWLGSALYGEVKVGDRLLTLEGKLLLQKNLGPWIIAYNASLEAAFEGAHLDERTGEMQNMLGISYELSHRLSIGSEVLQETEWPNWGKPASSRVWAGPNLSYHQGRFFAVLSPLVQLTQAKNEPDFQTRLIVGFSF